ncbi:MAG: AIR synthase family protein [Haloarculaceae archaeon]
MPADEPGLGKVDRAFFESHIYPRLGADRDDVALGPAHGVDFGVLDVGETGLVVATDPLSILPDLGFDRAARFALHVVLSDVAVSGLSPTHLTVDFALPPELTDEQFATLWKAIDEECSDLGVSIVSGHTARYPGCTFPWVGGATAMAVGDPADVVRPDGARPGDAVVVTKGPAVEATGFLTTLYPDAFDLPEETLRAAQANLAETALVRDATTAADAGRVHAMHDATECGLAGALVEMAESAGVRFAVDRARVPLRPGVAETWASLGVDPWHVTTSGTLVLAVAADDAAAVVDALEARETTAAVVGTVESGTGVAVDGEPLDHPGVDPSWELYADLAARE